MKKIKIGYLIISDVKWGGAEEVVFQLIKNISSESTEISLFLNNELADRFKGFSNINIYPLGYINKTSKWSILYSYFKMRSRLFAILNKLKLDLIHANLSGSLVVCLGLNEKYNIPLVFTLHGPEIYNYFTGKSLMDYWLLKYMLNKSKVITSPSAVQIEKLEEQYKKKTHVIPNGVDTGIFKPVRIKAENKVILFVGRFDELKGIRELVKVAGELPDYQFWFAGWGPLATLINLPNTRMLGFKNRNEIVTLNNQAAICCFPSHHESFGIVGLEAMSCGKPVIATKLGYSEYIENGVDGITIEPKNIKELKMAILTLMENTQLRNKLGNNARIKALKYDWKEISKKYLKVYDEIS